MQSHRASGRWEGWAVPISVSEATWMEGCSSQDSHPGGLLAAPGGELAAPLQTAVEGGSFPHRCIESERFPFHLPGEAGGVLSGVGERSGLLRASQPVSSLQVPLPDPEADSAPDPEAALPSEARQGRSLLLCSLPGVHTLRHSPILSPSRSQRRQEKTPTEEPRDLPAEWPAQARQLLAQALSPG